VQITSELLSASVRDFPDKVFIVERDRRISYREFDTAACRLANVLAERGLRRGDPVGLYLPSSAELAVGYHAAQKLGAIAAPMNPMFRRREVADIVERTAMPLLVTGDAGIDTAAAVADGGQLEVLKHGEPDERAQPLDELLAATDSWREPVGCHVEDVAALFFTSGTTGTPKGAMQSHRGIYFTLRDMDCYNRFRFGREVVLSVLPIFNNFGATCLMMGAVYNGATLVLHDRWDTERVLADIGRHRVTFTAGTPTMFVYLWKAYDPARHDLSSMRLAVAGGAPVAPRVLEASERELGLTVTQIYGATESCGYVTGEPVEGVRRSGSAGPAFGSSTISIVDDQDEVLPPGEVGEIVIGGDCIGVGYWRDEQATNDAFTHRGWHSGDLGYLDDDGYLFVVDRKKDVIISGGYNIHSLEVEDVLYRHPEVQMCALVGLPDEVKGEIPVAYVVPGADPSDELAADIVRFCREELAAYKVPREIRFVTEMPVGPSGKILKRTLRDAATTG
jgi:long-chain acyl-CoA synthetase